MLQSAPSSPSAFHHYARRPSCSANSPRFPAQVSAAAASRSKGCATSAPSQSPQFSRKYKNASTQYSPTGFPPTYRPPPQDTAQEAVPDPSASTAAAAVHEPAPAGPRPEIRIVPQPVAPSQAARPAAEASGEVANKHGRQVGDEEDQHSARKTDGDGRGDTGKEPASPAKRARPLDPSVKTLPLKYETCDVKDLGVLISDMLMELVRLNEGLPLGNGELTRFHSRAPPGISVRDYLNRIIVHATLSPPILLSMVFYVDKLCATYPAFTISSLTVHRFLITAATVAAKGLSDSFWTNSLYARVGGVSVRELAILELEFLKHLEWRIVPKPETLVDYYKGLVERNSGYTLEKEGEEEKEEASENLEKLDQQPPAPATEAESTKPTNPPQPPIA